MGREQKEMILGYRFSPTDEDLLYYLGKKVSGEALELPIDVLIDCDIYGDNREPWKLFDKSSNQILYVFTPLIKKSKSKIQRVAGSGSWNGRTETKEIKGGLGFMKYFVFKVKNDPRNTKNGYWVMHEFSLPDDDSYVLCRIQNKKPIPSLNPDDEDPIRESSASQETDSCVENSKKRRLNLGQDDQRSKKMRTGSVSSGSMGCTEEEQLSVAQEQSVAYQFQEESTPLDDGHEIAELAEVLESGQGSSSPSQHHSDDVLYQDPYLALDDANFIENLILENPYSPQSNLITEAEQDIGQGSLSVEDYLGCESEENLMDPCLLQSSENSGPVLPPEWTSKISDFDSEPTDADCLNFWLNDPQPPEENQSMWHDTNIQVTMPTFVF